MTGLQRIEEIWPLSNDQWLSVTIDFTMINPKRTLVICHGLTGEKIGPQKLLSNLSSYLAVRCNVRVVRFDFRGSGLSSGIFTDTSLESMCEDAIQVAKHFEPPLLWVGMSTGALVALMASAKRLKKENVIAISNGFSEAVVMTDIDDDPIPIRGGQLFLSKDYFIKRTLIKPRMDFFSKTGAVTVILGSKDPKHFSEFLSLQELGVRAHPIEGGDHLFTDSETRKNLFLCLEEEINGAA